MNNNRASMYGSFKDSLKLGFLYTQLCAGQILAYGCLIINFKRKIRK